MQKVDLSLTLGQKVTATLRGEKFGLNVRGWQPRQFIVLDAPALNGEVFRVVPETGCSVNYTREGEFVNFYTSVLYIYPNVVPLMLIGFPKKVDIHVLRKDRRFKSNFPMVYTFTIDNNSFSDQGTLRDLSIAGCLITHSKQLAKDTRVSLSFNLPVGSMENIDIKVENVRVNNRSQKEPYVTGVTFAALNQTQKDLLNRFLGERLSDRRKGSGRG